MNPRLLPKTLLLLALPTLGLLPATARAQQAPTTPDLQAVFQNLPEAVQSWVFWYWMNGAPAPAAQRLARQQRRDARPTGHYAPNGSEPGAEDLDAAKWKQSLKVTEIRLSAEPHVHQFESKSCKV
jgi:hypothetical protein